MDTPGPKICAHFNTKNLRNFEKMMTRERFQCDSCCTKITSIKKKSKLPEGLDLRNLLVCMSCYEIACKRQTENKCMMKHGEKTNHQVTYDLSYGSLWCYGCDAEMKEMLLANEGRKGLNGVEKKRLRELKTYVAAVDKCIQQLMKKIKERQMEKEMLREQEEEEEAKGMRIEEEEEEKKEDKKKKRASRKSSISRWGLDRIR